MYLKFLAVEGFKSFPERSGLELQPGTCIFVGGNGTGKSNLTDAVSWVLGQDDLAALRAQGPSDLVFAGSDELVAMDEANVTVVLDPRPARERGEALSALVCKHGHKAEHLDECPPGALTITRRISRDGVETVLLDGVQTTLTRVRQALADAGVSSPPVTLIRQGELERLLFLDPSERRRVIEAAAGIPGLVGESSILVERRAAALLRREHVSGELDAAEAQYDRLLRESQSLAAARALEAEAARLRAIAVRDVVKAAAPEVSIDVLTDLLHTLGLPADLADAGSSDHTDAWSSLEAAGDDRAGDTRADDLDEILARLAALGPLNTRAGVDLVALAAMRAELESELAEVDAELAAVDSEMAHRREEVATAFAAAFSRIDRRFRSYYSLLAPGGEAALVLTPTTTSAADESSPAEGVDVVARPPGKILDQVAALSGGERSLAALSLALAVFQEYPSPFFVLDEVEPALDDANIRRLQSVLDLVADDRQILMVSHQQRAKETGDVVFGVERNLDGASQVKFRYEPRTRKLDIFRRPWAADRLRRRPLDEGAASAPGLAEAGAPGSPAGDASLLGTPGPGAGPNRYRQRLFHEDGTFRGIWDAMGNPRDDSPGERATATVPTQPEVEMPSRHEDAPRVKPCT